MLFVMFPGCTVIQNWVSNYLLSFSLIANLLAVLFSLRLWSSWVASLLTNIILIPGTSNQYWMASLRGSVFYLSQFWSVTHWQLFLISCIWDALLYTKLPHYTDFLVRQSCLLFHPVLDLNKVISLKLLKAAANFNINSNNFIKDHGKILQTIVCKILHNHKVITSLLL